MLARLLQKTKNIRITKLFRSAWLCLGLSLATSLAVMAQAAAFQAIPSTESGSGSVGLQGTISSAAPAQAATIATPVNGASYTTLPITVDGLCTTGLLVKVFSNNVFVGSTLCVNGSYSIPIDLFGGQDQLVTRVYDALDQAGPDSNTVTVTFNDAQVVQFGSRVTLTSNYARRGANPGQELDWPIILSGGTGPYAVSVDWGDGSAEELLSESFPGQITISHTYKNAGVYNVIVKATDHNGTEAFLELVGVADGAVQSATASSSKSSTGTPAPVVKVEWWPAAAMIPLIGVTFWIGGRHELFSLRKQLEKQRNQSN